MWLVLVLVGWTTAESLFSQVVPGGVMSYFDGGNYEMGVKFQASVAGNVTHVYFIKGGSVTSDRQCSVWTSTGTLLGRG
jgi:hypothetical protein